MISKNTGILSVLAISASVLLSGCGGGDYPDGGTIDLSEVQKKAKIIAVDGNIYGVKSGAIDLVAAYNHDERALHYYGDAVVEALEQGEPVPELTLTYPELHKTALDGYEEAVKVQAQQHIDDGDVVFSVMDEPASAESDYKAAMRDQIITYIEKSVPLSVGGENVVFEGVREGYEALLAFAEITVEMGAGRDSFKTLEFVDLTPEAMKEADQIVFPFTRDGASQGRKFSPDMTSGRALFSVMDRLEGVANAR